MTVYHALLTVRPPGRAREVRTLCMWAFIPVVQSSILGSHALFVGHVKMGVLAEFTIWADFDGVVLRFSMCKVSESDSL